MTAFVRSGRPGWRLRTANPLIAGGPDPSAVIQIRDRLAAHVDAPAPGPAGAFVPMCTSGSRFAAIVTIRPRRLARFKQNLTNFETDSQEMHHRNQFASDSDFV